MSLERLLSLLLGWLLTSTALAQTGATLTGTVITMDGQPVPFATVAVLNSTLGATADQGGNFAIARVPAGRQTVAVSSVGYATRTYTMTVGTGPGAPLTFQLPASTAGLGEVVVSAQKDETTLQQTPMAVSDLVTKQLREYRVWDFKDLTALTPNLFVIEHANSTGGNFLNIRGVMGFSNEQAVATYVDGVYQFDYYSAPTQLLNIERIEVLRGPQGTLYGRNALGGVVNIVTRQPTNTPSGYAEVSVGNYGQQRYALAVQAPLVNYLGRYYFDYYNQDSQPGYALFNARAGVSSRHLELAFWVRNVFERTYITYSSLSPQSPLYMQGLPRLLGTTLTAKF